MVQKKLNCVNPLTLRAFRQKPIFGHFGDFQAGMNQSSSNLLKKRFATWQYAFLSTSIAFYDIFTHTCAEIKVRKWPTSLGFLLVFPFSFSFLFAAVIDLLLSSFPFKKFLESIIKMGNFYHGVATRSRTGNFTQGFHWSFLFIFRLHRADQFLLGIMRIPFPSPEVEYRWCQIWSKVMTSEVEQ